MTPDGGAEYAERLVRARTAMVGAGVDALCLSVGSDLPYMTGYRAMALERLTMFVVTLDAEPVVVIPSLEAPRVDRTVETFSVHGWGELEDPIAIVDTYLAGSSVVAVGDETWSRFTLDLQAASPNREWRSAGGLMSSLRTTKSPHELAALRSAARSVDTVVDAMAEVQFSGRTERDVARELVDRTLGEGHSTMEFWIVASGPNGASPHHEPGSRVIKRGDAVVVDFGGHQDGYASDTTRMFVVEEAPPGFEEAYDVLRSAQAAAVEHVRPGVTAASVDAVARDIIAGAGYGERFIHRTGHGIGMDTHEHPYIVESNTDVLGPGMAFSIEPGIYTPGQWGMRIEDIVAVTDEGVERINRSDRALRFVG
ncbi:MAG: M24 family metallopeptidase [Acidimicrobiia bacterium]